MKSCSNCNKRIWFFNRFHMRYGDGRVMDIKNNIIKKVNFCSIDCCMDYRPNENIAFGKDEFK